MFNIMKM